MRQIEWNLYFNQDAICAVINGREGIEPTLKLTGDVDANTHATIHVIMEVARCLMNGQSINHYFNPTVVHSEEDEYVKCQWMRSGKLVSSGKADKKYMHADTVDEAMLRKRVFTCTRHLYSLMPKRRPASSRPSRSSQSHTSQSPSKEKSNAESQLSATEPAETDSASESSSLHDSGQS
jgi:hypothetical protein